MVNHNGILRNFFDSSLVDLIGRYIYIIGRRHKRFLVPREFAHIQRNAWRDESGSTEFNGIKLFIHGNDSGKV